MTISNVVQANVKVLFEDKLRFTVDSVVFNIFLKTKQNCISRVDKTELELAVEAMSVMPLHIKYNIFENLNLESLIAILNADNQEFAEIAEHVIRRRLLLLLGSNFMGNYSLKNILMNFQGLYRDRRDLKYRSEILEPFNNLRSLDGCIELFVMHPNLLVEVLFNVFFYKHILLESEIEFMLAVIISGLKNADVSVRQITFYNVMSFCLDIAAALDSVKILNLIVQIEENLLLLFLKKAMRTAVLNNSRKFLMRFFQLVITYQHGIFGVRNTIAFILQGVMKLLVQKKRFDFVLEIADLIPASIKEVCLIVNILRLYYRELVEKRASIQSIVGVRILILQLIARGFFDG